jgi:hypothetical protein
MKACTINECRGLNFFCKGKISIILLFFPLFGIRHPRKLYHSFIPPTYYYLFFNTFPTGGLKKHLHDSERKSFLIYPMSHPVKMLKVENIVPKNIIKCLVFHKNHSIFSIWNGLHYVFPGNWVEPQDIDVVERQGSPVLA